MRKLTDIEQEVVNRYTTKLPNDTWEGSNSIAESLGVSPQTVKNILARRGVKIRTVKEAITGKACKPIKNLPTTSAPPCKCGCGKDTEWNQRKNRWNAYVDGHYRKHEKYKEKNWLEKEYSSGKTLTEIAESVGVTISSVKKFFDKFGLVARKHGDTLKLRGSVSGDKNPAWLGGTTPERQSLYKSDNWKNLVKEIYKRDGYRCKLCGANSNFNAHHIYSWAEYPNLRTDKDNLVTLCKDCHTWVHSRENKEMIFLGR